MAITLDWLAGTQTCSIGTEHTLNSPDPATTTGVFQLFLDVNALAAGDVLEVRMKEKVIAGGTARAMMWSLAGAQGADDALFATPPMTLGIGWSATIKQTAGTGRAIPWSLRRIA